MNNTFEELQNEVESADGAGSREPSTGRRDANDEPETPTPATLTPTPTTRPQSSVARLDVLSEIFSFLDDANKESHGSPVPVNSETESNYGGAGTGVGGVGCGGGGGVVVSENVSKLHAMSPAQLTDEVIFPCI